MGRYVVTGGVGFIGYHTTRALLAAGHSVVVVDDLSDAPYPKAEKERNLRDLRDAYGAVELVQACVTDRAALAAAFAGADRLIHLAGLAGVRPSFRDPARYVRVNVEGTATVLELAIEHGVSRVVFASSSSVYGNSTPLPAHEDAPAIVPESPYAASKRSAELVARAILLRAPTVSCAALRFFTVYGPRQRPDMAIHKFIRAIDRGEPVILRGDGATSRDYTYVDDIINGTVAAIERDTPGFRAYNLGGCHATRLDDLVARIGAALGKTPRVELVSEMLGDVQHTLASVARAHAELGYDPQVGLDEGLRRFVAWHRARPEH